MMAGAQCRRREARSQWQAPSAATAAMPGEGIAASRYAARNRKVYECITSRATDRSSVDSAALAPRTTYAETTTHGVTARLATGSRRSATKPASSANGATTRA